jgi:hypothetical protein
MHKYTNTQIHKYIKTQIHKYTKYNSYSLSRFVRQFLVSWISVLDSVPDSCTVRFLPEFLDPLLTILADPRSFPSPFHLSFHFTYP